MLRPILPFLGFFLLFGLVRGDLPQGAEGGVCFDGLERCLGLGGLQGSFRLDLFEVASGA